MLNNDPSHAPSFSVVTCTWNSAATVRDTIHSVLAQQHAKVEHIFVDGGSDDGTLEIIQELCPTAIVLRNVKGGISRAMNAGIEAATGEVISHLHSDDYYADHDVLAVVADHMADGAAWAYGKIDLLRGGVLVSADYPMRQFTLRRYAAGAASVPHPATFVRREAFKTVGMFDETLKYAMDIDLWFRLGARYAPRQINRVLTVFREHPGSLSTANMLKARQEEWRVRRGYFRLAPLATLRFALRQARRVWRIKRDMKAVHT